MIKANSRTHPGTMKHMALSHYGTAHWRLLVVGRYGDRGMPGLSPFSFKGLLTPRIWPQDAASFEDRTLAPSEPNRSLAGLDVDRHPHVG